MKKQSKDNRKSLPPVNGVMTCQRGHKWNVVDLNLERVNVNCPVCSDYISIRQGLEIIK